MIRFALAVTACLCGSSAGAACAPDEELFLGCTLQDGAKQVEVCVGEAGARYRFGPVGGAAELEMSRTFHDLLYTPWPGIGRTIWEEVGFENAGVIYRVHGAIERDYGATDADDIVVTQTGGIRVTEGAQDLATLTCDAGSVDFSWGTAMSDGMARSGLCAEGLDGLWTPCG